MFHLKAYFCWRVALLCWIPKRMKKQPRADFNTHIVFKENLHCRTTTSTCGRRWRDFTGSLKPSKDSLLKRKSDCQQNLSSISSQKKKKICNNFCLYPTLWAQPSKRKNNTAKQIVWQILLVPGTLWAQLFQIRKDNRAKSIFCLPCIACHSLLWEIVIKQRCPMPLKLFSPTTTTISEDVYNRKKKRMCAWLPR